MERNIRKGRAPTSLSAMALVTGMVLAVASLAAAGWSRRMGDAQNTGNAGAIGALTPETVDDLSVVDTFPVGRGYGTPVVSGELAVFGTGAGVVYVIDLEAKKVLVAFDTATIEGRHPGALAFGGVLASTPSLGTVTVPDGEGGTREEERVYVATDVSLTGRGLYCLNIDGIRADRASLDRDPGTNYVCEGADYPLVVASAINLGTPFQVLNADLHGSALFSRDQRIIVDGEEETRDVLYQPTAGDEGAGGEMWAIDAYTGETLWVWAPPNPLVPSTMWSAVSMNRDRTVIYITTSNLGFIGTLPVSHVTGNLGGGRGESIVAIDAATGEEVWFNQRRILDPIADLDIAVGVNVVDIDGPDGCHIVVNGDKDGCIYAYSQAPDIPEVDDPDYDSLRAGQQRVLWRQCFVNGGAGGGFACMHPAFDGRRIIAQSNGSQVGGSGNDTNAYAIDACTGELAWASSSVPRGQYDAVLASGMLFQRSNSNIQVLSAEDGTVLATAPVTAAGGGGGLAILPDGRIVTPSRDGMTVLAVVPGSGASPPVTAGNDSFAGPYPDPQGTNSANDIENALDPIRAGALALLGVFQLSVLE